MGDLWYWLIVVEIIGIAIFPVTHRLLAALPDRGWSVTKPFALFLIGFAIWFPLNVIQSLPFSRGWIVFTMLVLFGISAYLAYRDKEVLALFIRQQWIYLVAADAIYALGMGSLGWLRSFAPQIMSTEKFMDQAFLASIIRAQHLPPPDPWMSGYTINYYDLGHIILGILAKLLNTPSPVAYNVGIALTGGVTAVGIFGVAANLSAILVKRNASDRDDMLASAHQHLRKVIPAGLLSVVVVLLLGNLQSFFLLWNTMQARHLSIWHWLRTPALWVTYDWWAPSRAIPNTITEFPSFSFMLADLHAHVLVLPYVTVALSVALALWLMPLRKGMAMFGDGLARYARIVLIGMVFGGLYIINGWDLPTYLGLAVIVVIGHQLFAHAMQIDMLWLRNTGLTVAAVIAPSFLLYLPWYLTFQSPAQGIGLVAGTATHEAIPLSAPTAVYAANIFSRTFIGDELAMFGLGFFIVGTWLLVLIVQRMKTLLQSNSMPYSVTILLALLPIVHTERSKQEDTAPYQGFDTTLTIWSNVLVPVLMLAILTKATAFWEGWTFVWAIAAAVLTILVVLHTVFTDPVENMRLAFPLLLMSLSFLLIAICEVVYLKDVFAGSLPRMNTIFKFYYQIWLLLGIASAPAMTWFVTRFFDAIPSLWRQWQPVALVGRGIWFAAVLVLIGMSAIYPIATSNARYLSIGKSAQTLNGLTTISPYDISPTDVQGIQWLNNHVAGSPVIVEASKYADYTAFARVSTFTGLPTLMGWPGHEQQWRVKWLSDPQNANAVQTRIDAVKAIYTDSSNQHVLALLHAYHVTYLFVGQLEQQEYGSTADLGRFVQFLTPVYRNNGTTIYRVP